VPYARVSGRVETVGVEQLAGGVVSTSEFTALDGVTGNIQAQLNTKANAADVYTKAQVDASQAAQDTVIAQKANIADVYTKAQVDASQAAQDTVIAQKANSADVYTKSEVDTSQAAQDTVIAQKANIADVYTKAQVDASQAAQDTVIAQKANSADVYTKSEVDTSQAAQDSEISQRFRRQGESYVIVEVTNNPATNATNLVAAYAAATALTPYGQALSATNRAVVLLPPGQYDLGVGALSMTAEYVDVVGMSTVARHQHVYGQSNGANTGVVMQTANDVRLENLWVECTLSSGGLNFDATDPAAYFPDSDRPLTEVRNCVFTADDANARSMRIFITYSGKYTDCTGGGGAFGGYYGTASGTFTNCTGGFAAFGGGGTASGTFTNCTGGLYAFGGANGTASGTFTNCTGADLAFGGGGTASGTFTNCTGGGGAFGGYGGSTLNGRFVGCTMTGAAWPSTFRGRMENCRWGIGFPIGAEGRVYSSVILGNVTLSENGAGIANSSVKGSITVGGGVTPGFNLNNVADPDVN
jgi:3D (Asp-Asp-Asp) domain-containing protein